MRIAVFAALVVLGLSGIASAQLRVELSDGELRAGMMAVSTPYATGGPWASVRAQGLRSDVTPTVADFRIRSWIEGEGVRVIVFAVRHSEPAANQTVSAEEREEQIGSVFLPVDQPVEIAATEKYNARRITLLVTRLRRYVVDYHGIDIPVRPWTPPPRPR